MSNLHRAYSLLEAKNFDDGERTIYGIATSPTTDRMGDVVDPFGVTVAKDIPLFMFHDSTKVVGRATFGKPTKDGIPFTARLPKVAEPGLLKDRVDEAWQMVRHGLITAVSIGFRVLDGAAEHIKGGGLKFNKTEVMELSLVPVPAQADAVISGFKAMGTEAHAHPLLREIKAADINAEAALGQVRKGVPLIPRNYPGVSGKPTTTARGAVLLTPKAKP